MSLWALLILWASLYSTWNYTQYLVATYKGEKSEKESSCVYGWVCMCVCAYVSVYLFMGFFSDSDSKESACNVKGLGSIPGLGRSPGEGNENPLQYSCLENPMDQGAWWVTAHGVAKIDTTNWATEKQQCLFWGKCWSFWQICPLFYLLVSVERETLVVTCSRPDSPSNPDSATGRSRLVVLGSSALVLPSSEWEQWHLPS